MGNYAAALPLCRQELEIVRTALGESHPNYAASLNNLAVLHKELGEHTAALPLYRQALEIVRTAHGETHPDYATCLDNLARLHREMGNYAAALPLCRHALEIRRTALTEFHPDYASSLDNLAGMHEDMGDCSSALPYYRRALEIRGATIGENHPDYVAGLNNLAGLYHEMGDHAAAYPLFGRALDISRIALGENHPEYAVSLNNLAGLYREIGDYASALPLYRQALEITCTTQGESHPDYVNRLNNVAALYEDLGDYTAALPLRRRAAEIARTVLGENHPRYATCLNNLACLCRDMGDHVAALLSCRQALEIRRTVLGENHPEFASSLNNVAEMYEDLGDYVAALPLLRQSQEIVRNAMGENHPRYATCLDNLGCWYQDMGDPVNALPFLQQALEIVPTALGENHPFHAIVLSHLARLYAATGRASEALHLMEQAAAIVDRMIGHVFALGSDRQRLAHLNTAQIDQFGFISMVLQYLDDSPTAVQSALNLVLRRKAIAAEALATQHDTMLGNRYPVLQPKLRELAAMRMQIARKTLAGPGLDGVESHLHDLAEWNGRKEQLEAELAQQIPEMNLERKLRAADRRAVALYLPEGMALVEFVRFPIVDFQAVSARGESRWRPARYVAFVLHAGAPDEVRMIDLGEAEPLDRLIADFRAGIITGAEPGDGRDMGRRQQRIAPIEESDVGSVLRGALFDRLAPALASRTRLLIAPDGDLARLPFEVLPTSEGRRLIDDYQISYLSCGRDVLRFGAASDTQPGRPLVVADPDFDLDAEKRPVRELAPPPHFGGRRSRDMDRDCGDYHFHRLPGTRAEGERVATLLDVSPWLDATALEGRLKTACRSPRILHLATHGFFLLDQEPDLNQGSRDMELMQSNNPMGGVGRLSGPLMENPMLRSGLGWPGPTPGSRPAIRPRRPRTAC